jgi:hypothetical protein
VGSPVAVTSAVKASPTRPSLGTIESAMICGSASAGPTSAASLSRLSDPCSLVAVTRTESLPVRSAS